MTINMKDLILHEFLSKSMGDAGISIDDLLYPEILSKKLKDAGISEDEFMQTAWDILHKRDVALKAESDEIREKEIAEDNLIYDEFVKIVKAKMVGHDFTSINRNADITKGGCKAVKSSPDELRQLIKDYVLNNGDEYGRYESAEELDENWDIDLDAMIYSFLELYPDTLFEDLSTVEFDFENSAFKSFGTTDSGISYIIALAGGDWENPVYFIIYYDGEELRGYVPVAGNTYNYISNEAFGTSCAEDDAKLICKELGIDYPLKQRHEDFLKDIGMQQFSEDFGIDDSVFRADISAKLELI